MEPSESGDDLENRTMTPGEKVLEILGISNPARKLEKFLSSLNLKESPVNQGSFDIQAIYTEIDHGLGELGLDQLRGSLDKILREVVSRVPVEDAARLLETMKVPATLKLAEKFLEIININNIFERLKRVMLESGSRETGMQLKKMIEESVLQERVEDFRSYLVDIGIEDPDQALKRLLVAAGLDAFLEDLNEVFGWDEIVPL